MPGSWPEPFGLVAIEALACGTPVIARRIGGLPEIIRDGIDGFFGDDIGQLAFKVDGVDGLDRAAIRASVLERFSAQRMTDGYEAVYQTMVGEGSGTPDDGVTRLADARVGGRAADRSRGAGLRPVAGRGRLESTGRRGRASAPADPGASGLTSDVAPATLPPRRDPGRRPPGECGSRSWLI